MIIKQILGFILAFMEISLCYKIVCRMLFGKGEIRKKDKAVLIIAAIVLSVLLFQNRQYIFISYTMLLLLVFITTVAFVIFAKSRVFDIIVIVSTYYLIAALGEVFLGFLISVYLKGNFDRLVYFFADSGWKDLIYFIVTITV